VIPAFHRGLQSSGAADERGWRRRCKRNRCKSAQWIRLSNAIGAEISEIFRLGSWGAPRASAEATKSLKLGPAGPNFKLFAKPDFKLKLTFLQDFFRCLIEEEAICAAPEPA